MCIFMCFVRAFAHKDAKSHWLHLFVFSSLCNLIQMRHCLVAFVWLFSTVYFQMSLQIAFLIRFIVTPIAFVWFSPLCFKCFFQIACLNRCIVTLVTFVWIFSAVRFQRFLWIAYPKKMHCHTGHSCLTFPRCDFSHVSVNCLQNKMHSHTSHICLTFLHCAFSNVSLNHLHKKRRRHTSYICVTFLYCVFSNESLKR